MYPCIESTVEFNIAPKRAIRLWINENSVKDDYHLETHIDALIRFYSNREERPTNKEIIDFARESIPNLNAIQVKETIGNADYGVVAYLVDFSEDVHG